MLDEDIDLLPSDVQINLADEPGLLQTEDLTGPLLGDPAYTDP